MHKHLKHALGFALSAAMAVSMLAVGASATTYYVAPTTGIVVNDKILTGSGSNAGSTALSILRIDMAAINTSNALPGSGGRALSDEWGTDSES